MIQLPPPGYQQTIEAIAQCGVPRENIAITYEDELRSDEVRISDIGETTGRKLACLKTAVHPFYILTLENEAQQSAFIAQGRRIAQPIQRVTGVPSQKLLDRLTDACRAPNRWLVHGGGEEVRFRPDPDAEYDKVDCVLQQLKESRLPMNLGFVGNEAYSETEKK
ncbi:hypothetical protein ACBY01_14170 [Sphingomonas sp. ac-8]|uniref:hypothetical protein n=1 Tax=Sphingomonas sp. ac-8 TaxID=3242977 RepID=UPI003A811AD4